MTEPIEVLRRWAKTRDFWALLKFRPHQPPLAAIYDTSGATPIEALRSTEAQLVRWSPIGVALLWALAIEIDDRGQTLTGERVCRECSGRGDVLRLEGGGLLVIVCHYHAAYLTACRCAYNTLRMSTRPDTTSLAPIVAQLAAQRSPIVTDWPAQWLVNLDAMEAAGWRDLVLPGRPEMTPTWQCAWWRSFREWATAGTVPNADELAELLTERWVAACKAMAIPDLDL